MFEGMEYLLAVLLLGALLAVATWYVRGSDTQFARSKIVRWLLLWPVILDRDAQSAQQKPRGKSLLVLAIALVVIAVLAIVFTPPKGG
jgi:flagellar basal body-associated protein FliL